MAELPDAVATRNQVWDFLRAETVEYPGYCLSLVNFIRVFNGWSRRNRLPILNDDDVAAPLAQAGYELCTDLFGRPAVLGVRIRQNMKMPRK